MPAVTLRQIADRVGCSRALVSFALNGGGGVSPATRERIVQAAGKLGWTPNAALARQMALVRGTSARPAHSNLALIVNKSLADLEVEDAPRLHIEGACERARQFGYAIDLFNLAEEPLEPSRLRTILKARGIEGIVFIATLGHGSLSRAVLDLGRDFATAVVGVRFTDPAYHVGIGDFVANSVTTMRELKRAGFKRPVAILPRGVDEPLGWAFSAGLYAGQRQSYPRRPLPVFSSGTNENHIVPGDAAAIANFLRVHRPDAILTTDTRRMLLLLSHVEPGIRKAGLFNLGRSNEPGVAGGIDERFTLVGAAGIDLVVAQLHSNESGIPPVQRTIQIPGTWVWNRQPRQKIAGGRPRARAGAVSRAPRP